MKRIGLALLVTNMAASAMAFELEKVDLEALGNMELTAVSVEGIKSAGNPLASGMAGRLRDLNKLYNLLPPGAEKDRVYNEISELTGRMEGKWKYINLQAKDGTKVDVQYHVAAQADTSAVAEPVWITVTNPAFTGKEKISVVLINHYSGPHSGGESALNIALKYWGGKFIAPAGRVVLKDNTAYYRQEIAVVVDGNWLTDPVSQSHNFKFTMGDSLKLASTNQAPFKSAVCVEIADSFYGTDGKRAIRVELLNNGPEGRLYKLQFSTPSGVWPAEKIFLERMSDGTPRLRSAATGYDFTFNPGELKPGIENAHATSGQPRDFFDLHCDFK